MTYLNLGELADPVQKSRKCWEDLVEYAVEYYVGTEKGKAREEEKTKRMRKMTKTRMKIAERKRKPRDCWIKDQVVLKSLADTWNSASPSKTQSQVYIYYYIVICLAFHLDGKKTHKKIFLSLFNSCMPWVFRPTVTTAMLGASVPKRKLKWQWHQAYV